MNPSRERPRPLRLALAGAGAAVIASVTDRPVCASARRSWFEDDGAAAPVGCLRERFRGSCERIGGSDVDVKLALRERRGEKA